MRRAICKILGMLWILVLVGGPHSVTAVGFETPGIGPDYEYDDAPDSGFSQREWENMCVRWGKCYNRQNGWHYIVDVRDGYIYLDPVEPEVYEDAPYAFDVKYKGPKNKQQIQEYLQHEPGYEAEHPYMEPITKEQFDAVESLNKRDEKTLPEPSSFPVDKSIQDNMPEWEGAEQKPYTSNKDLISPIPNANCKLGSSFGCRRIIIPHLRHIRRYNGWPHMHNGVDISRTADNKRFQDGKMPVQVVGDGCKVIFKGRRGNYGKRVVIRCSNGCKFAYNHLHSFDPKVKVNAVLPKGTILGKIGGTNKPHLKNFATHLDFEAECHGKLMNPVQVIPPEKFCTGTPMGSFKERKNSCVGVKPLKGRKVKKSKRKPKSRRRGRGRRSSK